MTGPVSPEVVAGPGARAAGAQRTLVGLTGLVSLGAGGTALLAGSGLLGADHPVLDTTVLDALRAHQSTARAVAIAIGVALLVLGVFWTVRALTPERRSNLVLDPSPDGRLEISASAIAGALRADAETIDGVNRARARMAGTTDTPVLCLNLWLEDGADVRAVYHDLDTRVLSRARDSLGTSCLATAVRIELDAAPPTRVS
ncbi:MAG: alkaline shock response membrane anchor protein AmaP [Pseudonocardiales bacterium]|nr:MAG: alkaline shock response membrane anchor protein AmaP [Pseudonocardiales bacterium]